MTVNVDASRCIGCGMCAAAVPAVFQIQGRVSVVQAQPRTPAEEAGAFDAANGARSMPSGPGRHEKEPPAGAFQRAAFFIQSRFTRKSPRAAASAAAVCPRPGHPASHR